MNESYRLLNSRTQDKEKSRKSKDDYKSPEYDSCPGSIYSCSLEQRRKCQYTYSRAVLLRNTLHQFQEELSSLEDDTLCSSLRETLRAILPGQDTFATELSANIHELNIEQLLDSYECCQALLRSYESQSIHSVSWLDMSAKEFPYCKVWRHRG